MSSDSPTQAPSWRVRRRSSWFRDVPSKRAELLVPAWTSRQTGNHEDPEGRPEDHGRIGEGGIAQVVPCHGTTAGEKRLSREIHVPKAQGCECRPPQPLQ